MARHLCVGLAVLVCISGSLFAEEAENLRLTLPPAGYAVVGAEMNVFFENLVLTEKLEGLQFSVESALGTADKTHWTVTSPPSAVGVHDWRVTVSRGDKLLADGTMKWVVSPAKVTEDRPVSLLIIGDSLTHATVYPNDLAQRLTESGLTQWKMLGTHRPSNAAARVAHEGYGGWRWQTFVEHYEPNPDPDRAKRKHSSPFVYLIDEQPKLDVGRYVQEVCQGSAPDFVIFKLGINDCFGADASEPAKTDVTIDAVFQHAETLLAAFRQAAPLAELAICLTTPGNRREGAFQNNYQGAYPRWGWKRIQHRLVERQLDQFANREQDRIFLVPTELNLDPDGGYPEDNAVHPNSIGYRQISASMHAWLMSRLSTRP